MLKSKKNVLMWSISVVWWMAYRSTTFFFFVMLWDQIQRSRLSPVTVSQVVLKDKVFSPLPCSMTGNHWRCVFHNDMPYPKLLEILWRNSPNAFWIPLEGVLRCWIKGEWPLVAIIELPCKNRTLLFIRYPQIILNRRQALNEKEICFWHLIQKQMPQVTTVHIFAPSTSASILKESLYDFPHGRGFWSGDIPPYKPNLSLGVKFKTFLIQEAFSGL